MQVFDAGNDEAGHKGSATGAKVSGVGPNPLWNSLTRLVRLRRRRLRTRSQKLGTNLSTCPASWRPGQLDSWSSTSGFCGWGNCDCLAPRCYLPRFTRLGATTSSQPPLMYGNQVGRFLYYYRNTLISLIIIPYYKELNQSVMALKSISPDPVPIP